MTARQRQRNGRRGGKIGGLSKSPAKIAAVRENGLKGGRPRKPVPVLTIAEVVASEWAKYQKNHPEFNETVMRESRRITVHLK
jgi:hypothetical protein